jgi:hypothetical protein
MEDHKFQAIGHVMHLNELPQWDRPPMVGIHAKGKGQGIFSNVSVIWE